MAAADVKAKAAQAEQDITAAQAARDEAVAAARAAVEERRAAAVDAATQNIQQARATIESARKAITTADAIATKTLAEAKAVADAREKKVVATVKHQLAEAEAEAEQADAQAKAASDAQTALDEEAHGAVDAVREHVTNATAAAEAEAEEDEDQGSEAHDRAKEALNDVKDSIKAIESALQAAERAETQAAAEEAEPAANSTSAEEPTEEGAEAEAEAEAEPAAEAEEAGEEAEPKEAEETSGEAEEAKEDEKEETEAEEAKEEAEAEAKEEAKEEAEEAAAEEASAKEGEAADDEAAAADEAAEPRFRQVRSPSVDSLRDAAALSRAEDEANSFERASAATLADDLQSQADGVAAIIGNTQRFLGRQDAVRHARSGGVPRFRQQGMHQAPLTPARDEAARAPAPAPRPSAAPAHAPRFASSRGKAAAKDVNRFGVNFGRGSRFGNNAYPDSANLGFTWGSYGGYGSNNGQPYQGSTMTELHDPYSNVIAPYPTVGTAHSSLASTSPSPTPPGAMYNGPYGDQPYLPGYNFRERRSASRPAAPVPPAARPHSHHHAGSSAALLQAAASSLRGAPSAKQLPLAATAAEASAARSNARAAPAPASVRVNLASLLSNSAWGEIQMRFAQRRVMPGRDGLIDGNRYGPPTSVEGSALAHPFASPPPESNVDAHTPDAPDAVEEAFNRVRKSSVVSDVLDSLTASEEESDSLDEEEQRALLHKQADAMGADFFNANSRGVLSLLQTATKATRPAGFVLPVDLFKDQNPTQDYVSNTNMAMAGNANAYMNNAQPAFAPVSEFGENIAAASATPSPAPRFFDGTYERPPMPYN